MAHPMGASDEFRDKVVIVTGGGRGIGKTISETFAESGATVCLCDNNPRTLVAVGEGLRARGFDVFWVEVDVSSSESVKGLVENVLDRTGRIDILVNNAGINNSVLIENMTEQEWDRVIDVNLKGVFLCTKAVIPVMKEQKSGIIINMASPAGKTGGVKVPCAHYSASKAGIVALTKATARELAVYGIRTNAISPGLIVTEMMEDLPKAGREELLDMIPLRRVGTPADVANTAVFLASEKSSYITGQVIPVNGGMWMLY